MPSPFYYRRVLNRLAQLADAPNPPHVQVRAACALADELSPANPRRDLIRQMLETANPYEFARHKLRDLYDQAELLQTSPSGGGVPHLCGAEGAAPQEEDLAEEDDDPLKPLVSTDLLFFFAFVFFSGDPNHPPPRRTRRHAAAVTTRICHTALKIPH